MPEQPTILVVDDEMIVAMDIRAMLEQAGYTVPAVVGTGEMALQKAAELRPDLILMDIVLRGAIDGIQAAATIREQFGIPIVFLTAHTDPATLERAKRTEPYGYIVKPFDERDLHTTIQIALHKSAAQKKLKESESRYRSVVEGSLQGIAIIQDGVFQYVNSAYTTILGCTSPDELLGKPAASVVAPEYATTILKRREACLRGETVRPHPGWQGVRKDSSLIWLESTSSPFTWQNRPAVLSFILDISERKNLEVQIRHAQKMESIGHLAGGVAHDFNNLLTVILGYSDMLLARAPAGDRPYLQEIRKAGERAAMLTRQLLAFSSNQLLAPVVLNPNSIVEEVQTYLPGQLGKDIAVQTLLDPSVGLVKVDPCQFKQVLLNLALNSRDAMPTGGVLTIETRNVELDNSYAHAHPEVSPGPYVLMQISDTGYGIDEYTKNHIFEPFFTTKEQGKGTGLGLAMVYGVIKQSDGHIELESDPGRGTSFKIYLPRHQVCPTPGSNALPTSSLPGATETVLVVEDEAGIRRVAKLALEKKGYKVLEAENGACALALVEGHTGPIDIVVTDVVMPQMGGRELVGELLARRPNLKVLYLSGYTDDVILRHSVGEEQLAFLAKPYTAAMLAQKVRAVLDNKQ